MRVAGGTWVAAAGGGGRYPGNDPSVNMNGGRLWGDTHTTHAAAVLH
jgi:hypothetical protein